MQKYEEELSRLTNKILEDSHLSNDDYKKLALQFQSGSDLILIHLKKIDQKIASNLNLKPLNLQKNQSMDVKNANKVDYMTPESMHSMDYPFETDMEKDDFDDDLDYYNNQQIIEDKITSRKLKKDEKKDISSLKLSANVPENLILNYIPLEMEPILQLYQDKILDYSKFEYAPSMDLTQGYDWLTENGESESIQLGPGIYYSGELDVFCKPQNRGFYVSIETPIKKFFIGELFKGKFHGKGLLISTSNYSWILDSEDFFGFSLKELKERLKMLGVSQQNNQSRSSDIYFNILEGEWRDGEIINGILDSYKNTDNNLLINTLALDSQISKQKDLTQPDLMYKGSFKNSIPHQIGTQTCVMKWKDGSSYEGGFVDGKRSGKGTFFSVLTEEMYEGQFKDNQRFGEGLCVYSDGS